MLRTLSEINAQLEQYFRADDSRENARMAGLRAEMAEKEAERARIRATQEPELKAIRAQVKGQIEAEHNQIRAAAGERKPWLRLPTVAPSPVSVAPLENIEDFDAWLAEVKAKYAPTE